MDPRPRRILTLDGGGVRGTYQAQILDLLCEEKMNVYDLIVGVSAGALNGILAAQQTCTHLEVFSHPHCQEICRKSILDKVAGRVQPWPIYSAAGKKRVIQTYTSAPRFGDLKIPTAVVCYSINDRYPQVFRSWQDSNESTVDLALATSAAPVFYPAHRYKDRWYIDGGVAINNPACLGFALGKELFPGEELRVLSIGTGDTPNIQLDTEKLDEWGSIQWVTKGLFNLFTYSPSQYSDEVCSILFPGQYLRIEDDTLGSIEPDDSSLDSYQRMIAAGKATFARVSSQIRKFWSLESP